ncbi:MAG: hypothetical protein BMS9Abin05_2355 [Rhodothermia bacterium]|nr:MAG: hypothetical protein BMS9Abin05_2355 [Rhodothermia bacterium]
MATPTVGSVVLVRFPFSDLSDFKLRPAFVLADVGKDDFLLCQITSRRYEDSGALSLLDDHFSEGSLQRESFIRPEKLFTANETLIEREIGKLTVEYWKTVVRSIVELLQRSIPGQ